MGLLKTGIVQKTVFKDGKKLYPTVLTFSNIGNEQLVDYLATNSGINKGLAIAAVNALRNVFDNYLLNGHTVQIPQLGTFSLSAKCKLADKEKDAGAKCIQRVKIRYTPKTTVKAACKSAKFESIGIVE